MFGIESGFSTLEVLIAMVILVLTMTAVILVLFGGQTLTTDAKTNQEAIYKAQEWLERARGSASLDFDSVNTIPPTNDDIYTRELVIDTSRSTNCKKEVISKVTWSAGPNRPQLVQLTTDFSNTPLAFQLAGDCPATPPTGTGNDLTEVFSINEPTSGETTGLDVLHKFVYLGLDSSPGFLIFDATVPASAFKINVTNGFSLPGRINEIDAADHPSDGKTYAYIANDNTVAPFQQLLVVDVTTKNAPVMVASASLPGVTGTCPFSCPQGRSVFFFDDKVYVGTHRLLVAGANEFHVYGVADPLNPQWLGSYKLDHNINDILVTKQDVAGVEKTIAYLATSADSEEVIVLDVTTPAVISKINSLDIPSSIIDAISLDLDKIKNILYLGRNSGGGSELYTVDIQDLQTPLGASSIKDSADVGDSVLGIRAVGNFAYLGTDSTTGEFQIWDSNPTNLTRINNMNISNKSATGVDYDDHYIYLSIEQGSKTLSILRAP